MGCSCSNKPLTQMTTQTNKDNKKLISAMDLGGNTEDRAWDNLYKVKFQTFESPLLQSHCNLLVYTAENSSNDFIVLDWEGVEKTEQSPFKLPYNSLVVGYIKGYKIDCLNQDKFFVLVDGENEAYCVVDGHGPYGDIIAQIVQDKFFEYIRSNSDKDLENDYKKIFKNVFNDIQLVLINREVKDEVAYDPFISGCAMTLLIKKGKWMYSANLGNVLAFLISNDKLCPSKVFIDQLTIDDSKISFDKVGEKKEGEVKNIHSDFNMHEELRRIYENGGEIRRLAGEDVSRIFIKGKYFPGVINTRALGDQIGNGIGILPVPHIARYHLKPETVYKLIMCSDGIGKNCSVEKIANIIQENDNLLLDSVNMIISEAQGFYKSTAYSPDMTIIIKELKRRKPY